MAKARTEAQFRRLLQNAIDRGIQNSRKPLEDLTKETIEAIKKDIAS